LSGNTCRYQIGYGDFGLLGPKFVAEYPKFAERVKIAERSNFGDP
jgi:hypothetical protein